MFESSVEILAWNLFLQMVVVGHLAIGMDDPVEASADAAEHIDPIFAIFIAEENVFLPVSARGNVVKRAGKFESERSGYSYSIS